MTVGARVTHCAHACDSANSMLVCSRDADCSAYASAICAGDAACAKRIRRRAAPVSDRGAVPAWLRTCGSP
ncbi:MAG: hypothetical protein U0263_41080 [Polyangiaceae bacterium]